jgi:hypothetical protein
MSMLIALILIIHLLGASLLMPWRMVFPERITLEKPSVEKTGILITHSDHGGSGAGVETITSDSGYKLAMITYPLHPLYDRPTRMYFQVQDKFDRVVTKFDIVHEKIAHVIIVSEDLHTYQHIHPEMVEPGWMRVDTKFPRKGLYRIYFQCTPTKAEEMTFKSNTWVNYSRPPRVDLKLDADKPKDIDGYTFKVSSLPTAENEMVQFNVDISKKGRPVRNIRKYLGAGGHGVIISADGKEFLHVHPMTEAVKGNYFSPIGFHTAVPRKGIYKVWVQVLIDGKVRTVDWTFKV